MKCTSLYTKTMIMRKISYIICKKYKCRHGEILVNATGLSPVEKSCGFESHWRHNRPHGQTGKVAWFRPKSSPSSNLGGGTKLKLKYGS